MNAPGLLHGKLRSALFGVLLLVAMATATFTAASLGILARFLIDDFEISRAQVGLVIGVTTVAAALLSPVVGRLTDLLGARRAFAGTFLVSGAAFLLIGAAPVYATLFVGAITAAVAQAAANPATNKLIALHLPEGRRGVITGIKQSGVQAGIFLGGLLVPSGALALGWRPTVVLVALIPLLALPVAFLVVPADAPGGGVRLRWGRPAPPIVWLAVYGFLLGFAGAVTFLVPLFVEEALGSTVRVGGAAAAFIGLAAFFGRIGWAQLSERLGTYLSSLGAIAVLSVAASALFLVAQEQAAWALWPAVVVTGLSSSSWNSVGMLAVISEAGWDRAGSASGVVMLGFLAGLGLGPPLYGWTVDATSGYTAMWLISIAASVASVAWVGAFPRLHRSRPPG